MKEVFEESKIKREDIFITTKIIDHDKKDVEAALRGSLKKL